MWEAVRAVMVVSVKVLVPCVRFQYLPRCSSSGWMRVVTNRHHHRVPRNPSDAAQASDPVVRVCHLCHRRRYHRR